MSPHARIAKGRIRTLRELDRRIKDLTSQIEGLVAGSGTSLCDIYGVGILVAATILAEVGNPRRYATKAKFAMANGTAPLEASSGRVVRHRLNRGGNRRLNQAIHTVALTQIARPDTEGRRYYQKLIARGKDQPRSHASTQTAHLGPYLDPPPRVIHSFHSPRFDIGAQSRSLKFHSYWSCPVCWGVAAMIGGPPVP